MVGLLSAFPKRIIVLVTIGLVLLVLLILAMISTFGSGGSGEQRGQLHEDSLPTPAILLPPDVENKSTRNITFNLGRPTLPSTAFAYKISYGVDSDWAQTIAEAFNFNQNPKRIPSVDGKDISLWTNGEAEGLSVTLETGFLEYSRSNLDDLVLPARTPTTDQIITVAKKFLKDHSLYPPGISADSRSIGYYTDHGGEVEEIDNVDRADTYELPFTRTLDGLPIYEQYGQTAPIHVWIRKDLSVAKVSFQYANINESSKIPVKLTGLEAARNRLLRGEGTIVNFEPGELDVKNELAPESMTLTKVSVSYFDDKTSSVLQPIYVFEGTANYSGYGEEPVVIYLPALGSAARTE